jgi:alpha-tubulin suppressor-like RCC1 family protein
VDDRETEKERYQQLEQVIEGVRVSGWTADPIENTLGPCLREDALVFASDGPPEQGTVAIDTSRVAKELKALWQSGFTFYRYAGDGSPCTGWTVQGSELVSEWDRDDRRTVWGVRQSGIHLSFRGPTIERKGRPLAAAHGGSETYTVLGIEADALIVTAGAKRGEPVVAYRADRVRHWWRSRAACERDLETGPTASELTDIIRVTAGSAHSCALTESGEIWCWGANRSGQLGMGEFSDCRRRPTRVKGITDAVEVVAGGVHTCARRKNGQVVCWGDNEFGQVGDGGKEDRSSPTMVNSLPHIKRLAAGIGQTCAIGMKGLYCWGYDGSVLHERKIAEKPRRIRQLAGRAKDLSLGYEHLCILRPDGTVECRGDNLLGQLSGPDNIRIDKFRRVTRLKNGRQVVSGYNHNCVLRKNGTVACFGTNLLGEVRPISEGSGFRRPMTVPGLRGIRLLAASSSETCALHQAGNITCFGPFYARQLGRDTDLEDGAHLVPVPGITDAVHLSIGEGHTCVVLKQGRVRCFGKNDYGQLGDGTPIECATRDPLPDTFALEEGDTSRSGLEVIWE